MIRTGKSIVDLANRIRVSETALWGNANPLDILEDLVDRMQGTVRYKNDGIAVVSFYEIAGDEHIAPALREVTHYCTLRLLNSGDWALA